MDGHVNLRDAARGECIFKDPKSGKQYSLKQKVAYHAMHTCLIFRIQHSESISTHEHKPRDACEHASALKSQSR